MEDIELVNIALNGFLVLWEPFFRGLLARKKLTNLKILCNDCIQEEIQMESKATKKGSDENLALFS